MSKLCENCEKRWLNNAECEEMCSESIFFDKGYKQGREDAIDKILSICHHSYTVADVVNALKQLKEQKK